MGDRTASPLWERSVPDGAIRQCELLSEVQVHIVKVLDEGDVEVEALTLTSALVISQDCDLDWDWKNRSGDTPNSLKELPSVLLLELRAAQNAYNGPLRGEWRQLKQNKNDRYHFFEKVPANADLHDEGLQELVADFKRYHTVPTRILYEAIQKGRTRRRTVLAPPYLQHLSQRFGAFLGRVALPLDHQSDP